MNMDEKNCLIFIILSSLCASLMLVTSDEQSPKLADAINDFSIRFYKETIKSKKDNLVCSGFSVAAVLNMLLAGARTTTADEIRNALGYNTYSLSTDQSQGSYHNVLTSLRNATDYDLNVANSMWIQEGFDIRSSFNSVINNTFLAFLGQSDFKEQPSKARNEINKWVSDQTKGKIPTLFDDNLPQSTKFVLVNAMYFKGQWVTKFPKTLTEDYPFQIKKNSVRKIPMMNVQSAFSYTEDSDLDAKILQLPYRGKDVSMFIVLPRSNDGLTAMENGLTLKKVKSAISNLFPTNVVVKIPKFNSTATLPLNEALQTLGIREAFSDRADLSGIDGTRDLNVNDAIQKALIEVNEEGTVAAAATGIRGGCGRKRACTGVSIRIEYFIADHPFLYFIYHKPSDAFLFMGRFSNP